MTDNSTQTAGQRERIMTPALCPAAQGPRGQADMGPWTSQRGKDHPAKPENTWASEPPTLGPHLPETPQRARGKAHTARPSPEAETRTRLSHSTGVPIQASWPGIPPRGPELHLQGRGSDACRESPKPCDQEWGAVPRGTVGPWGGAGGLGDTRTGAWHPSGGSRQHQTR